MHTAHIVTLPHSDVALYFSDHQIKVASIPRTGEYLTIDDKENMGQAFEVVAVIHPADPRPTMATVELVVRHVGLESELLGLLSR